MTELLHANLTHQIIGVYYTVYNKLSRTYPEFIYERAMMALLERSGIRCTRQEEYEIRYKEYRAGYQRLDLFVAGEVIVELKVAASITPLHLAQLLSYLKVVPKEVGLLCRFGGPEPEFARRVLTPRAWSETMQPDPAASAEQEDWLYPEVTHQVIGGALEVFKTLGPGFIYRIYANACYHELRLRGLEIKPHHEFHVFLEGLDLGSVKFSHLQVDNRILFFPVALAHINSLNLVNLRSWMRYLNIPLAILANFNTTKLKPIILRI
jgi:GxxExxY protein